MIVCQVTAADISQLPSRLEFNSGNCTLQLTSALLGTKITLTCSGGAGFLDTDPATTLQIADGSCQGNVKLLGLTIGAFTATGQLSTITITGTAVTYQAGGAQFIVTVPGVGIGLNCGISGSLVLDPNAAIPILIHPPLPAC
jgi:hypothetical protein